MGKRARAEVTSAEEHSWKFDERVTDVSREVRREKRKKCTAFLRLRLIRLIVKTEFEMGRRNVRRASLSLRQTDTLKKTRDSPVNE